MKVLNLTQHKATPEQVTAGVVDSTSPYLKDLLTFDELPTQRHLKVVAGHMANMAVAEDVDFAMVGGAPFLMEPLCDALRRCGVTPLFAFSKRESEEQTMPDGSVRKVAVFKHLGFVEAD